jgi:hypothetical protein
MLHKLVPDFEGDGICKEVRVVSDSVYETKVLLDPYMLRRTYMGMDVFTESVYVENRNVNRPHRECIRTMIRTH